MNGIEGSIFTASDFTYPPPWHTGKIRKGNMRVVGGETEKKGRIQGFWGRSYYILNNQFPSYISYIYLILDRLLSFLPASHGQGFELSQPLRPCVAVKSTAMLHFQPARAYATQIYVLGFPNIQGLGTVIASINTSACKRLDAPRMHHGVSLHCSLELCSARIAFALQYR